MWHPGSLYLFLYWKLPVPVAEHALLTCTYISYTDGGKSLGGRQHSIRVDESWWRRDSKAYYHIVEEDLGNQAVVVKMSQIALYLRKVP